MDIYQEASPLQIKQELGWSNKTGQEAISELQAAVMLLCDRVAELEAKKNADEILKSTSDN